LKGRRAEDGNGLESSEISSVFLKKKCQRHFQSIFKNVSEIFSEILLVVVLKGSVTDISKVFLKTFSEILLAIVLELGVEVSDLALHAPAKLVMLEAGPSSISPRPNRIFPS